VFLAYCVNMAEMLGTVLLAARLLVVPICVILSFIYVTGIVLFHRHEGFFVVGPAQAAGSTARYSSLACWLQHGKTESVGYAEKLVHSVFAGVQSAQRWPSLGA
jgi:hypothetical protein